MADSVNITLTPEEEQTLVLDLFGNLLLVEFAEVVTKALLCGGFILLFYTSSASILRQGLGPRSRKAMFSLTLITFVFATVDLAVCISGFVIQVQSILLHNLDVPLAERARLTSHSFFLFTVIGRWVEGLLPIISDIVVIWRAWVLFFENRWVMIGPLTLLLGTITTTLSSLIPQFKPDVPQATLTKGGSKLGDVVNNLRTASITLSLATNALATLMIVYKLWRHRAFLTEMLRSNQLRFRAQNVLIILVEAGVLYFVLQLTTFLVSVGRVPSWGMYALGKIFFAVYFEFTAMYPTIVVVLVNHQRSFVDTCGFSNLDLNGAQAHDSNDPMRRATVGHLSFVRHRTNASIDELLETQNLIEEKNTDGEVEVSDTRTLKGTVMVDVDVEERQAKTAPF